MWRPVTALVLPALLASCASSAPTLVEDIRIQQSSSEPQGQAKLIIGNIPEKWHRIRPETVGLSGMAIVLRHEEGALITVVPLRLTAPSIADAIDEQRVRLIASGAGVSDKTVSEDGKTVSFLMTTKTADDVWMSGKITVKTVLERPLIVLGITGAWPSSHDHQMLQDYSSVVRASNLIY